MAHAHNDSPNDDTVSHSSGEEGASDTACGGDEEEFVRPQKRRRLSYEPQQRVAACTPVCPPPVQPVHVPSNANNIKLLVPQVSMLEQSRMYNNKFAVPLPRSFIKQEPIMSSYPHAAPFPVYAQPQVPHFVALSAPHTASEEYYMPACVPSAPSPVPCYANYASEYAGDIQYLLSEPSAPMESFDAYFPANTEHYNGVSYQSGAIDIFGM